MADGPHTPWWRTTTAVLLATVAAMGALFLLEEHWRHAFGVLPYLLLLACPLMHLFHKHGRHRGHAHRTPDAGSDPSGKPGDTQ